ncbi:MAG: hypothetical protein KDB53_01250 [Planctomycetes bacterium]|nr:hypothetical protein [Planctomycetota bacterium]
MTLCCLVALLALGSCAHERFAAEDRVASSAYRHTGYRATHSPWGTVIVRELRDRRPSEELGRENYLKDSWYSESLFARPVGVTIRELMLSELDASDVLRSATPPQPAEYLIDLRVLHFGAKADRDLIGLIPVIPSIDIEGIIEIEVKLTDPDGRPFLDERYRYEDSQLVATIAGVEASAAELMVQLMSRFMAEVVPAIDAAIPRLWESLGMRVPPSSQISIAQ